MKGSRVSHEIRTMKQSENLQPAFFWETNVKEMKTGIFVTVYIEKE